MVARRRVLLEEAAAGQERALVFPADVADLAGIWDGD